MSGFLPSTTMGVTPGPWGDHTLWDLPGSTSPEAGSIYQGLGVCNRLEVDG